MNDKVKPAEKHAKADAVEAISGTEMEELKRDMRTARLVEWAQTHQQQLIAAAVAVVVAIVGASLWWEHAKSMRDSAAMLYHRGIDASAEDVRGELLRQVVADYHDTSYAALSLMLLAAADDEQAGTYLEELLKHPRLTEELAWQARLDLAGWHLRHQRKEAARSWLAEAVGPHYEQLRQYLLSEAADDKAAATQHLRQALDAASHDENLKRTIEQRLAALAVAPAEGE